MPHTLRSRSKHAPHLCTLCRACVSSRAEKDARTLRSIVRQIACCVVYERQRVLQQAAVALLACLVLASKLSSLHAKLACQLACCIMLLKLYYTVLANTFS